LDIFAAVEFLVFIGSSGRIVPYLGRPLNPGYLRVS
jgi:hypothetical protein